MEIFDGPKQTEVRAVVTLDSFDRVALLLASERNELNSHS